MFEISITFFPTWAGLPITGKIHFEFVMSNEIVFGTFALSNWTCAFAFVVSHSNRYLPSCDVDPSIGLSLAGVDSLLAVSGISSSFFVSDSRMGLSVSSRANSITSARLFTNCAK